MKERLLTNTEPIDVFHYFEDLTFIPRESGNENFDFTQLKGDYVINVDSDDEGVVVVGCAGGPVVKVNLPIRKVPAEHKKEYYAIKITGLRGGHSGEDIHRGRANANKLLIRVLRALEENVRFDLSDITGGLKYNAIPRNAEAVIGIEKEDKTAVDAVIERFRAMFQRIISLTKAYDGIYEVMSDCPAWEFDSESQLKKKFEDVFRDLYGKDPSFMILNVGLEPCEFAVKVDRKLDMISLGPDMRDLHAPGEYVVISSTQRVWECFKRLIESL